MTSIVWPAEGGGSAFWGDAVADQASLPPSGVIGEVRLTLDTKNLYEWDGTQWVKILDFTDTVIGPGSSVDAQFALFNGTTGAIIKAATGTGPVKATSGVYSTGNISLTAEVSGILPIANGGTNSSTSLNNNRVMVSSSSKIMEASAITASRSLISDANGIPTHSSVTSTELGYVSGVTSSIQTQLGTKVNLAGDTMTGLLVLSADPATGLGAATKQYVDNLSNGLKWKSAARAATTTSGTLASSFQNGSTVDGVTLATGDRILIKNQSTASQNGIYVVAASGAPTRAVDADSFGELNSAVVMISEGTANASRGFIQTAILTSLSDSQTWVQNFGTGLYSADGQGIKLSGSTFSLDLDATTLSKSATGLKVATGGITDTEIASSAGITRSKTATGTAYRILANSASGVLSENAAITASRAVASDANGQLVAATTTATELGYVNGVTSAIQTQFDTIRAVRGNVSVSSNVTLTDQRLHLVSTAAPRTLTLPAASATVFLVVKDSTGQAQPNPITVNPASGTIDGASSFIIDANYQSVTFVSDGTNYFVI